MANDEETRPDNTAPTVDQRIAELEARNAQLEQRYAASSQEGQRLAQQVNALTQRTVPQRGTASERLTEMGIPADAFEEIVQERIGTAIQRAFEPITQGFKARNEMLAKYPDFGKFEADVAAFVHQDPEVNERYQRIFATDPVAANEYAYLKFGAQEQKKPRAQRSNSREESAHASIPTERSGESRRTPPEDGQLQDAREAVEKSGRSRDTVERFAKLRLKRAISDDFLNQ